MIYWTWIEGIRMSEEKAKSLRTQDIKDMKKFWAGCMTKEQQQEFVKKYPDNNWGY